MCVCAALDICVLRKGPGELAASVIISLRPKKTMFSILCLLCSLRYFKRTLKNVSSNYSSGLSACLDDILCILYNMYAMSNSQIQHVWKCYLMYNTSPLSEGDGGSLSSRSSAEDMVPVDGVLGSLLLKSPGKW